MRWTLLLSLVVACGGGAGNPDTGGFDFPDAPFFRPDSPSDGSCAMTCGGTCVDTQTNPNDCGFCGHVCPTQTPSCLAGACIAPLQTQWTKHFGGADFGNTITSVGTDDAGDVYVTGTMSGTIDLGGGNRTSHGSADILVASFTSAGAHRWSKVFGSTDLDQGSRLAVGGGVVYVIADFIGTVDFGNGPVLSKGRSDIVVLALDANTGDYVNARTFGTVNSDTGIGIAYDVSGQVAISGFFAAGTIDLGGPSLTGVGADNGFLASLDLGFNGRWARRLSSNSASDLSSGQAVGVDPNGNVTVVGAFSGSVDFGGGAITANGSDAFVASYGFDGMPRWSHSFGAAQYDSADTVAVDEQGNVYVGGSYHGNVDFGTGGIPSTGLVDGFVVGYSPSGAFRFARHLGAATSSAVNSLVATKTNGIYVTGRLSGAADLGTGALAPLGQDDIFIAGLAGANATFAKRYGGTDFDEGIGVSVTPTGLIVAGGEFRGTVDLGTGTIVGGAKDNGFLMMLTP